MTPLFPLPPRLGPGRDLRSPSAHSANAWRWVRWDRAPAPVRGGDRGGTPSRETPRAGQTAARSASHPPRGPAWARAAALGPRPGRRGPCQRSPWPPGRSRGRPPPRRGRGTTRSRAGGRSGTVSIWTRSPGWVARPGACGPPRGGHGGRGGGGAPAGGSTRWPCRVRGRGGACPWPPPGRGPSGAGAAAAPTSDRDGVGAGVVQDLEAEAGLPAAGDGRRRGLPSGQRMADEVDGGASGLGERGANGSPIRGHKRGAPCAEGSHTRRRRPPRFPLRRSLPC